MCICRRNDMLDRTLDGVLYCPIYLAGLLKKQRLPEDYIYQMDLSILQDA